MNICPYCGAPGDFYFNPQITQITPVPSAGATPGKWSCGILGWKTIDNFETAFSFFNVISHYSQQVIVTAIGSWRMYGFFVPG